jgi:hypothetical protein
MIFFLTNQDPSTSRTRALIDFFENDYNRSYKIILLSRKSFAKVFVEIFNFIRIYKPQKIIIGYNSRTLLIPIYLIKLFFKFSVIYDLGYPVSDIPKINLVRRNILYFLDYCLMNISDLILVESLEQKYYIEKKYKKSVLVYFTFFDFPPVMKTNSLFDFNYFLFRGRLNIESGILDWISEYIKYKRHGSYKLVILGYGNLEYEVHELIKNHSIDIIFLNKYIIESELISIIANAACLLGQINSSENRLQKTIPHKFFESIFFRKVYLGYLFPPVRTIVGDIYFECGLQIDPKISNNEISNLFFNFESFNKNMLDEIVEKAYLLFELNHTQNKNNFAQIL